MLNRWFDEYFENQEAINVGSGDVQMVAIQEWCCCRSLDKANVLCSGINVENSTDFCLETGKPMSEHCVSKVIKDLGLSNNCSGCNKPDEEASVVVWKSGVLKFY